MAGTRRQAVEALPMRKRQAVSGRTVDTFVQGKGPNEGPSQMGRLVNGLFDFTGKAVDFAVNEQKTKIDLDKITQQQRALKGLDPTDDATKAGLRSYQIVKMRDQILEVNSDLAREARENPEMSDEDFEKLTREKYAPILEQYQPDPELTQAASNRLQESQAQVLQIREAAQREHRDWKKKQAFGTSIESYREASQTTDELSAMIQEGGQLYNESDAMGLSPQEFQQRLLEMATLDASSGDARLLSAVEEQDWASSDPRVAKARETFQAWNANNSAVEIGTKWGDLQAAWMNRTASWESISQGIEDLNNKYPGSITAGQVATLRKKAASKQSRDTEVNAMYEDTVLSGNSVGLDPTKSNADRKDIMEKHGEVIDANIDQAIAAGNMDPLEGAEMKLTERLFFAKEKDIVADGLKPVVSNLLNANPEYWRGEGVPDKFKPVLGLINQMDAADVDNYASSSAQKRRLNFYRKRGNGTNSDADTWVKSWEAMKGGEQLTGKAKQESDDNARALVRDHVEARFYEIGRSSAPEWVVDMLTRQASDLVDSSIGAGAEDWETAHEAAVEELFAKDVSILNSGTVLNVSRHDFVVRSEHRGAERAYTLELAEVDDMLERFFNENVEDFQMETQIDDLGIQDVQFIVTPSNGLVVKDRWGEPLTETPVPIKTLTKEYKIGVEEDRIESMERERTRTEELVKEAEEYPSAREAIDSMIKSEED